MSGFVGLLTSKRFKQDSKPTQEENVTVLKNEEMHDEMESMEQADFLVMKRTDYRNVRPFIFDNERYGLVFDGTIYNKETYVKS